MRITLVAATCCALAMSGCGGSEARLVTAEAVIAPRHVADHATVARIEAVYFAGCGAGTTEGRIVGGRDSTWLIGYYHLAPVGITCAGPEYPARFGVDVPISASRTRVGVIGVADTLWFTIDRGGADSISTLTLLSQATRHPLASQHVVLRPWSTSTELWSGESGSDGTLTLPRLCDPAGRYVLQANPGSIAFTALEVTTADLCGAGAQIIASVMP